MNSLYRYRNVASIIEATPFRNPLQGAAAIQSQIRWRLRDSRCYSGSGSSNKSNGSFNWGPPMALFAAAGLGYFYFFSSKDKKKAPASSSGNPLDSLDKLQDAEVVFVLGGEAFYIPLLAYLIHKPRKRSWGWKGNAVQSSCKGLQICAFICRRLASCRKVTTRL